MVAFASIRVYSAHFLGVYIPAIFPIRVSPLRFNIRLTLLCYVDLVQTDINTEEQQ